MAVPDPAASSPIPDKLTDLLYTGVGLGVLAVNKVQVARRDAEKRRKAGNGSDPLSRVQRAMAHPDAAATVLRRLHTELRDADERMGGIENRITALLDRIEPDLPPPAQELVSALRDLAADNSAQVRAVLGLRVR